MAPVRVPEGGETHGPGVGDVDRLHAAGHRVHGTGMVIEAVEGEGDVASDVENLPIAQAQTGGAIPKAFR